MFYSQLITIVLATGVAQVQAKAMRGAGSTVEKLCNLAWSNSGTHLQTDCTVIAAAVVFSDVESRLIYNDTQVLDSMADPSVTNMMYMSVGTVNPEHPLDERLLNYQWKSNTDTDTDGNQWGDFWFNPNDLISGVLPIMKDVIAHAKELGYQQVSSDNANPNQVVTANDEQAKYWNDQERIDPRYVDYMNQLVDYAHSIDMQVTLKNPGYYNKETEVLAKFDSYIIESVFSYPGDLDFYGPTLASNKPTWIFQYEGINGVTNEKLRSRMLAADIDMVYMDSEHGWVEFYSQ